MTWELPPGWRLRAVGESLTPVRAQAKPRDIPDECAYVGLEHVRSGTGEYEAIDAGHAGIRSSKFRFEPGDVLYGKLRPNLRKCIVAATAGVCSTDLVPLRPVKPEAAHLLAMQMRSEPFTARVMRLVAGANLPRVNVGDLLTIALPAPPEEDEDRLYAVAEAVASLHRVLRNLERSIVDVDLAATAEVLGLASRAGHSLSASSRSSP